MKIHDPDSETEFDPEPPLPATLPEMPAVLPLLPLRNRVIFPGTEELIRVGRDSSQLLVQDALRGSRTIGIFTQKYDAEDDPGVRGLCRVGVVAKIVRYRPLAQGRCEILVHPLHRIVVDRVRDQSPFILAEVSVPAPINPSRQDRHWQATLRELRDVLTQLIAQGGNAWGAGRQARLEAETDPGAIADLAAASLTLEVQSQQDLLEECDVARRVRAVLRLALDELKISQLRRKIRRDVDARFAEGQRRAYLKEQLHVIRRELGEGINEGERQVRDLQERLAAAKLPEIAAQQAQRELRRLGLLRPSSAEFPLVVDYIQTLAELPWNQRTEDNFDLEWARRILDHDHFGLENVKRRIIEYLAVKKRNPGGRFPVLCFLGPPGVGKSSLGRSIATALGRKFACLRLGGLRDEAEINGTRWSRPGAAPGRPIRELQRLGVANPVMMLDEIDQIAPDARGDPINALLEILDAADHAGFVDRFLDTPFDVSQVLFIATASYADDIPPAVRGRLQMVRISGYSDTDKHEIARQYLVPRLIAEYGLKAKECQFGRAALRLVVNDYTREAGVGVLERNLAALCRATVAELATTERKAIQITPAVVEEVLGPPRYLREPRLTGPKVGVVAGLSWTSAGGEIMLIEALRYPGKGLIQLTGQIGGVMRESAQAALSLLKVRAASLGIRDADILDSDLHVHVPAGAVSKDGPSAGVAIFTAISSLWTGRRVRSDVAMTGEITLRGLVLPIGGLKEKILAAQRAGIRTVILPKLNQKDLSEVPASIRTQMQFVLATTVDDVLADALAPVASRGARRSAGRAKTVAVPGPTEPLAADPQSV